MSRSARTVIPRVAERPAGTVFRVRERALAIATDDPAVEHFLHAAYGRTRTERADGPIHAGEIAVHGRGGPRLAFDGEPVAWPREAGSGGAAFINAFYGARELFRLTAVRAAGCWALYGAAVGLNGAAIVIVGPSGIGKTTLVLELVERGARLYGDECIFVEKETMMVTGLPRSLMIREPSLKLVNLPALAAACDGAPCEKLAGGRLWYAVEPRDVFGRDVDAAPAPLGGLFVIDGERAESPVATPLPAAVAAPEFARRLHGKFGDLRELRDASRLLGRAAAYRLQLGAPDATAALIACLAAP